MTVQQVTIDAGQHQPGDYVAFTDALDQDRSVLVESDSAIRDADVLVGWTVEKKYASNEYEAKSLHFRIKPVRANYSRNPTSWRVYAPKGGRYASEFVKAAKTVQEAAEKAVAIGIERGYLQTQTEADVAAREQTRRLVEVLDQMALDKANRIERSALVEFKAGRERLTIEANDQGRVFVRQGSSLMVLSTEQADELADALRKVAARARLDSRIEEPA